MAQKAVYDKLCCAQSRKITAVEQKQKAKLQIPTSEMNKFFPVCYQSFPSCMAIANCWKVCSDSYNTQLFKEMNFQCVGKQIRNTVPQ
jgi:hypothetical protein